jgi:hypothetical protein
MAARKVVKKAVWRVASRGSQTVDSRVSAMAAQKVLHSVESTAVSWDLAMVGMKASKLVEMKAGSKAAYWAVTRVE